MQKIIDFNGEVDFQEAAASGTAITKREINNCFY